jgi:uncharacterized Tic20 family protein
MAELTPSTEPVSPYAGFTPLAPSDEKLWAALIQIGGIGSGFFVPLLGLLLLGKRGPFVREHAVAALNWQITLVLIYFVSTILFIVVIGYLLFFAAFALSIVFGIIAAQHAHRGQLYTYPLAIKFVSV